MENKSKLTVKDTVSKMIWKIEHPIDKGSATALLANLRNSAQTELSNSNNIWPFLFENMPEEFLSTNGQETPEEAAIVTTLQLYAICMQGSSATVRNDEGFAGSIGASLKAGKIASEDTTALDRRFNVLISKDTFPGLVYQLRSIVKLVKSKATLTINFPKLAEDLYSYQKFDPKKVMMKWAIDYYRSPDSQTKETKQEDIDHD